MNTRLFVGSLPYTATELSLKQIFEEIGLVVYTKIIRNKETKLSRGFGFVEMATSEEAKNALKLNGYKIKDRIITVKEAIPMQSNTILQDDGVSNHVNS